MAANIAPIEVKFKVDTSGLQKAEQAVQKSGESLKGRFGKIGKAAGIALAAGITAASIGAARALSSFFSTAIDDAIDLNESINAVSVTFGDLAGEVNTLAEGAADRVGLAASEFNAVAVQFSSFAETIAGDGGDVVGVLDELITRGADFASVMNIEDVNEALFKFQSALSGEAEPLKRFGINVSETNVKMFALENGLIAAGEQMTEQQKIIARYGFLMQETEKVAGDFSNTSDQNANALRIMQKQMKDTRAAIGNELLPIQLELVLAFKESLPVIKEQLVPAVSELAGQFKDNILPALVNLLPKVISFVTVIATNIDKIAAMVGIVGTLAATIKTYTAIQIALNIAMSSNPIGLIITAVGVLIPLLVLLFGDTEKLKEGFEKFIETGERIAGVFMQGLGMAFQYVGEFFQSIPDKLASFGETLYNFGRDVWQNFVQGALDVLFFLPSKVADIVGAIPGLEGLAEGIRSGIGASRDVISGMTGTSNTGPSFASQGRGGQTIVNNYNVQARGLTVDQVQRDAKRRSNLMSPVLGGA